MILSVPRRLFCLVLACVAAVAQAQTNSESSSVSGFGSATIQQKPTLVRMTLQIEGKGKNLKEAMGKLNDRRDAAILQLESLGAKKESIVASDANLGGTESEQQRQLQRMMIQQLRASGRAVKTASAAKTVAVSSVLKAEWPLTAKTHEELLTFAQDLQDKIVAADLAGTKQQQELSPEEAELQEELAQMTSQYGYDENQPKPGEPQFAYVAKISEEEREKALATAFEKAKRHAEKLAAAAGAKLGNLSSLNGTTSQSSESNPYAAMQNAYAMQMLMAQQQAFSPEQQNDDEGFAPNPQAVTFQVMVTATFALK